MSISGSGSSSTPSGREVNEGTRIGPAPWIARPEPWMAEQLFKHHFAAIREAYGSCQPGYLVVALHGDSIVSGFANVTLESAVRRDVLTIGRHQRCGLLLEHDPTVALRHILARVTKTAAGLQLRLWDLRSGQGFMIDGVGKCTAALIDNGDTTVRVGSYTLMCLWVREDMPELDEDPEVAWAKRPKTVVVDDSEDVLRRIATSRKMIKPQRESRVTVAPGVADLSQVQAVREIPSDAAATLGAGDGKEALLYPLTEEQLRCGVLLGRYDRCDFQPAWVRDPDSVSRVHALLLLEGDEVLVFDTASTNGVIVDGVPCDVARLRTCAVLELAEGNWLLWKWLRANEEVGGYGIPVDCSKN